MAPGEVAMEKYSALYNEWIIRIGYYPPRGTVSLGHVEGAEAKSIRFTKFTSHA